MRPRLLEWRLAVLSMITCMVVLVAGGVLAPGDGRVHMLVGALVGFATYLVIGLYPGRR